MYFVECSFFFVRPADPVPNANFVDLGLNGNTAKFTVNATQLLKSAVERGD